MPDNAIAVWDGRFQPLHRGHVAVIEAIIHQFKTELAVMIIQSSEGAKDEYGKEVDRHHALSRNPLSFWERLTLFKLALANTAISNKVTLIGIPRPDLHWDIARAFYPEDRFICLTGKDEYERRKEIFWEGLGERTRLIDTSRIEKISATAVKEALKGGEDWERYLPNGTVSYFKQINAPDRFRRADL